MSHDAFLADICAHPDDDTPRLIYADWLQDTCRPPQDERAEFIRVQCELATLTACELDGRDAKDCTAISKDNESYRITVICQHCRRRLEMRRRQDELLAKKQGSWIIEFVMRMPEGHRSPLLPIMSKDATRVGEWPSDDYMFRFRRGFIEETTLTAESWLTHHAAIRAATPLRKVWLTTRPEIRIDCYLPNAYRDPKDHRTLFVRCRASWGNRRNLTLDVAIQISDAAYKNRQQREEAQQKLAAFADKAFSLKGILEHPEGWFPGIEFELPPLTYRGLPITVEETLPPMVHDPLIEEVINLHRMGL